MTVPVQDFTLHTHTRGFDGRHSIADMVAAARDAGMHTIGISNHFIVHPRIKETRMYPYTVRGGFSAIYSASFDEAIDKFRTHYDELAKVSASSDIRILRGMEVDFFDTPEWHDGFARAMEILKPDYCIGSSHFVEHNGELNNTHDMRGADRATRDQLLTLYWAKIGRAAQSGLFNWMAHLDLPKKLGLGVGDAWVANEQAAVRAIANSGTAVEINTSISPEPYPSLRIMRMLADENVPVLLSDDAHDAADIGRRFGLARRLAKDSGIKRFCDVNAILR